MSLVTTDMWEMMPVRAVVNIAQFFTTWGKPQSPEQKKNKNKKNKQTNKQTKQTTICGY